MAPTLLPRHETATWRAQAAASQRDRLLVAMADACVDTGYANTRVADVISRAGVSRRTFYEFFDNLEDCFLATYDRGVEALSEILAAALAELPPDVGWRETLRSLVRTYLEVLAAEPAFSQFALVEVLAAGRAARDRYLATVDRFHSLVRLVDDLACREEGRTDPTSDLVLAMFAGGINRFAMTEVLAGRGGELAHHADAISDLAMRMLGGAQPASGKYSP